MRKRTPWLLFLAVAFIGLALSVPAFAAAVAVDPNSNLGILIQMMVQAGLGSFVQWLTAAVTIASALDAVIAQPAPGSHWLPVRKLLSAIALSFGNAANATQPSAMTWVKRVLQPLVDAQIAQTVPAPAPVQFVPPKPPAPAPVVAPPAPPPPPAAPAPVFVAADPTPPAIPTQTT